MRSNPSCVFQPSHRRLKTTRFSPAVCDSTPVIPGAVMRYGLRQATMIAVGFEKCVTSVAPAAEVAAVFWPLQKDCVRLRIAG